MLPRTVDPRHVDAKHAILRGVDSNWSRAHQRASSAKESTTELLSAPGAGTDWVRLDPCLGSHELRRVYPCTRMSLCLSGGGFHSRLGMIRPATKSPGTE